MKRVLYLLPLLFWIMETQAQTADYNLLIGTYTNTGKSEGIYVYDFNTQTAAFRAKCIGKNVTNPSYLTVSKDNHFVYSVNEDGENSTISAFSFDPVTGTLDFLNKLDSKGADPCYVISDQINVIAANYSGGSIVVLGRDTSGALTGPKQVIKHSGSSIDPKGRQKSPHVHMVKFTPDGKYVLSNDLGTDKVYLYKYHANSVDNVLELSDSIAVKAGSGPRHLTFSKNGKFAYLLQEINGDVTVFKYQNGHLKVLQQTNIVPDDFTGESGAADIHLTPNGKFLYATNRGTANSITRFAVQNDGTLVKKSSIPTAGKGPRNFTIDPSGNYLLVAHQYTNNVVIFKINKETGALSDTHKRIELGAPVCLVFTANK
jgi:6-phosphogluconolactonase